MSSVFFDDHRSVLETRKHAHTQLLQLSNRETLTFSSSIDLVGQRKRSILYSIQDERWLCRPVTTPNFQGWSQSRWVPSISIPSVHQEREAAGCKPKLDQRTMYSPSNVNDVARVCQER
jgi:hypothetical protein